MAIDVNSQAFKDAVSYINANAGNDIPTAVSELRSTQFNIEDPNDIATVLAYSNFGSDPSSGGSASTASSGSSGPSVSTLLGIPTSIGAVSSIFSGTSSVLKQDQATIAQDLKNIQASQDMQGVDYTYDDAVAKLNKDQMQQQIDSAQAAAHPGGIQGAMLAVMTTVAMAAAQAENFMRAEKAAENDSATNILALAGVAALADFATMFWLSKLWPGTFEAIPHGLPWTDPVWLVTFAVASGITGLVTTAGVIAGKLGSDGAPTTNVGTAVKNMLAQVGPWYNTLPTGSVGLLVSGLTIAGMSPSLSPTSHFQQFSVQTMDLSSALQTATGDSNAMGARVFVQKGATATAPDTVYLISPQPNGTSTVSMFQTDTNGVLIGPDGNPATSYLPIAQPVLANGKPSTDIQINQGSLNALLEIPACMAIANDPNMDAKTRESALETCMRGNKNVQFVPTTL